MTVPGHVEELDAVENATVEIEAPDGPLSGYLARPSEPGEYPGLLVLHEAFGLVDHIRDVCRRFANIGYVALAPDLYSRIGTPEPGTNEHLEKMVALFDEGVVRDLEAAAGHVRGLEGSTGKLGCIGFCSGGRQTLLLACSSDVLDAAVYCWGGYVTRATPDAVVTPERPRPVLDLFDRLHCPLLAVFGEEDTNPGPEIAAYMRKRSELVAHEVRVKAYRGAGHAFFAD